MSITFHCEHCGKEIKAPGEAAGPFTFYPVMPGVAYAIAPDFGIVTTDPDRLKSLVGRRKGSFPTIEATSAGVPYRPRVTTSSAKVRRSSPRPAMSSVSMNPGATTLTVIPRDPTSFATDRLKPIIPALAAA